MKDKNDHSELDLDQLSNTYSGASSWDDGIENEDDSPPTSLDGDEVNESLYEIPVPENVTEPAHVSQGKKPKSKKFKILLYSGGSLLLILLVAGVGMIYVLKGQEAQRVPSPVMPQNTHGLRTSPVQHALTTLHSAPQSGNGSNIGSVMGAGSTSRADKEVNSLSLGVKPITEPSSLDLGTPSSMNTIPSVASSTPSIATTHSSLLTPVAHSNAPQVSAEAAQTTAHTHANSAAIKALTEQVAKLKAKISHETVELKTQTIAPKVVYKYIYVHPKVVTPRINWTVRAISGGKAIVHVPGVGDVGVQRGSTIRGVTIRSIGSNGISTSEGFISR